MAITRIKNSTISNKTPKYNDVLAGLPFRPIIGTATDGGNGTSVSVAFTGNNVANGTITYTALSSPGGLTGTGTASPITVSGLTSGTAYTFQVKAGNSLGDSAYSAASNSVTPATPSSFESIATSQPASGSTSLTFSNIPGTYQHLQLRSYYRRLNSSSGSTSIRFNSDSGSNYNVHYLEGTGSAVSAGGFSYTAIYGIWVSSGTTVADTFGVGITDIHDYASTSKNKTVRSFSGTETSSVHNVALTSGLWRNTNAITSITITFEGDQCGSGCVFALYGIKGA